MQHWGRSVFARRQKVRISPGTHRLSKNIREVQPHYWALLSLLHWSCTDGTTDFTRVPSLGIHLVSLEHVQAKQELHVILLEDCNGRGEMRFANLDGGLGNQRFRISAQESGSNRGDGEIDGWSWGCQDAVPAQQDEGKEVADGRALRRRSDGKTMQNGEPKTGGGTANGARG